MGQTEFQSFSSGAQQGLGYDLVQLVTQRGQTVTRGAACHTVLHLCINSGSLNTTTAICPVQMLLFSCGQSLIRLNVFIALLCTCTYTNPCAFCLCKFSVTYRSLGLISGYMI